jgi:hypothetical protein
MDNEAAISAAVTAMNDPYIVFVPLSGSVATAWIFGTGNVTSPRSGALTFTAPLAGATSATLSTNFIGPTASYTLLFSDGSTRAATLTNGSVAVSWTGDGQRKLLWRRRRQRRLLHQLRRSPPRQRGR